jgi:hypothetical protein
MDNHISIAYPILSQSTLTSFENEFNDIIYYQDYKFEIKYELNTFINVVLTNISLLKTSTVNITKSNLPLNKLHKLLIQSLNKVPNYEIIIDDINNNIKLSYITDLVELIETIELTELNTLNTIELLERFKTTESLLRDKISILETFIENHMEINISNSANNPIIIKYNSPEIMIMYKLIYNIDNFNKKCLLLGNNDYHIDFKSIKCNLLIIDLLSDPNYNKRLDLEYLIYIPLTVSKLIIKNGDYMYQYSKIVRIDSKKYFTDNKVDQQIINYQQKPYRINDFLKKIDPNTNLQVIEFDSCTINKIYKSVLHLKLLKTIIIKNCPNFLESSMLRQNGFIVELF